MYISKIRAIINTQPQKENTMKHNFQIRMDKLLFDRVKALAEAEHRNITAQIHSMLEVEAARREEEK